MYVSSWHIYAGRLYIVRLIRTAYGVCLIRYVDKTS